jgi:hypothetical protein
MYTASLFCSAPPTLQKESTVVNSVCDVPSFEAYRAEETEGCLNVFSIPTLLVRGDPRSTRFVRVVDSTSRLNANDPHESVVLETEHAGVCAGDVLTIDRALSPTLGTLVLAMHDNALLLCRFTEHEGRRFLVGGNGTRIVFEVGGEEGVHVWGVVTAVVRAL